MRAKRIINKNIEPYEYYLVSFQSQQDIDDFIKKSPWFDKEDAQIGKRFVVKYRNTDEPYYEIFEINHFINWLKEINNVYAEIYNVAVQFFQNN